MATQYPIYVVGGVVSLTETGLRQYPISMALVSDTPAQAAGGGGSSIAVIIQNQFRSRRK